MVQKKFNILQAILGFVLMYTTIVTGLLLRESPLTPIGIGVVAIIVLVMLKFMNKVTPTSKSFMGRWIFMIILVEIGTFLTFCFIAEIVWNVLQLPYDLRLYDTFMALYILPVSGIYLGIVYHDEHTRYNSFGLSESFDRVIEDTPGNYKLELYKFHSIKDHSAFKWLRRLALHLIYPIASLLGYVALTYKQVSKVGYGIVGILSVITFIFIFRIVWEGRDENEGNTPTQESTGENTQSS